MCQISRRKLNDELHHALTHNVPLFRTFIIKSVMFSVRFVGLSGSEIIQNLLKSFEKQSLRIFGRGNLNPGI